MTWQTKADENLTAHDIREMRAVANRVIWEEGRPLPPMPIRIDLYATLRNEEPVARLHMTDVTGGYRQLDLSPADAISLAIDLVTFVRQVGVTSTGI